MQKAWNEFFPASVGQPVEEPRKGHRTGPFTGLTAIRGANLDRNLKSLAICRFRIKRQAGYRWGR